MLRNFVSISPGGTKLAKFRLQKFTKSYPLNTKESHMQPKWGGGGGEGGLEGREWRNEGKAATGYLAPLRRSIFSRHFLAVSLIP